MRKLNKSGDEFPNRHSHQPLLPFGDLTGSAADRGDRFAQYASRLDETGEPEGHAYGLARPALLLAADEYPGLTIQRYINKLDDLADDALQSALVGARNDFDAARRLALFLAATHGFRGAEGACYYDPRNSYINDVFDTRMGIPITLSLVLIEVGRRLGLPMTGIGFPGHFLVGCGPSRRGEYLLLDQYAGGRVIDRAECKERLKALGIEFVPEKHLAPISSRDLFLRLLGNLSAIYTKAGDVERTLRIVRRTLQLDPSRVEDYRRLAAHFSAEGELASARSFLRAYLESVDPACRAGFDPSQNDDCENSDILSAREHLSRLLELRALRN